jgi:predicted aconitase with swiveling domain
VSASPPVQDGQAQVQPIVLHGRKVVGGAAEGEALVTRETISGWGGIHAMTGMVIESRHELKGVSFAGKVLVFPGAKGSSGWSNAFHMAKLAGKAPLAMVFTVMTTKVALGAVVMRVPAVTDLDGDPFTLIATGDWVRVDGDHGRVEIWKGGRPPA